MYYLIDTMLRSCSSEECHRGEYQYVAVLSPEEWTGESAQFEMGIDLDLNVDQIYTTKAEVNYDSVTGTFDIPDRNSMTGDYHKFAFALDEKGIVFIDYGNITSQIIDRIKNTKSGGCHVWKDLSMIFWNR